MGEVLRVRTGAQLSRAAEAARRSLPERVRAARREGAHAERLRAEAYHTGQCEICFVSMTYSAILLNLKDSLLLCSSIQVDVAVQRFHEHRRQVYCTVLL